MTIALVGPLCLCLLAAAPSRLSKLEQGQKAFGEGDYSVALKALDQAAAEGADLEKVQLLRAQCFAAQQDFGRAEEAFALALEANPEASLDPTRVDPSVVKVLDGLRARTKGTVVVRSTPPGAVVFLDGKEIGPTPVDLQTVIGRHKVEAKWPGGGGANSDVLTRARRETYLVLVQGEATGAPGPLEPGEEKGSGIRPFAEVRGLLETGGGVYGAMEIGGGIELKYFRAGLHLRLVPNFGLSPRVALVVPVIPKLSAFVEAEVPMIFENSVAVGLGASGGVEWHVFRFIGAFIAIGGRHFFDNPIFINNDRFELSVGVRLRLP
jgi:hypothetical protein